MTASEPSHDHAGRDHAAMARRLGAERAARDPEAGAALLELLGVVYRLRDDDGCPWDREQTLDSMLANLLEEAAEVAQAQAARDDAHVAEELGDVLMNVVLMARIAEQEGRFSLVGVARGIATKLVRRHPHVFGEAAADDPEAALASWNAIKRDERRGDAAARVLDGVPAALPAVLRAVRVGEKAAGVGFDWPDPSGALDKLREEVDELDRARAAGDAGAVAEELGDVLFAACNVARGHGLDPELVLGRAIEKFRRRFAALEDALGDRLASATLDEMEAAWRAAAARERG